MAKYTAACGIRGIEHIGICVPDIEAATRFFVDVLGGIVLYDLLDEPVRGPALARLVGVSENAAILNIRFIRLGYGANIELFQYAGTDQNPAPRHCDFGVQHFALHVDDIDAAVARLTEAGCRLPGGINDLPGADSGKGNQFAYVSLPWGGWLELVATPSPQRYESGTSLRRWWPETAASR